ncbi:MAG: hypothetical protein ACC645_05565 [Pirellulales bacterium]
MIQTDRLSTRLEFPDQQRLALGDLTQDIYSELLAPLLARHVGAELS